MKLESAIAIICMYNVFFQTGTFFSVIGSVWTVAMSSVKVEPVIKSSALIGEGPVWEESEQTLLFVDIASQKIHRWSPTTNEVESVQTGVTVEEVYKYKLGSFSYYLI